MQFKLLVLSLAAAAAAMPSPAESDGDVSIQATKKWEAKGGCKSDWAGRCNAQCIGEASQKGYKCKNLDSNISGGCFLTHSTCKCTCFY